MDRLKKIGTEFLRFPPFLLGSFYFLKGTVHIGADAGVFPSELSRNPWDEDSSFYQNITEHNISDILDISIGLFVISALASLRKN